MLRIPIVRALHITEGTARNLAVKSKFPQLRKDVAAGQALGDVFEKAEIFPPLMLCLIRTGADTAQLPEMLAELADVYEEEAERAVAGAVRLLEPTLILVMGAVIAGIVAAIILPIFQANAMVG